MAHSVDKYWNFRNYCEKKNINLRYCDALIDFLKKHEGIYEPQDVSFYVLDKFLSSNKINFGLINTFTPTNQFELWNAQAQYYV